jgi:hypothetical protein
MGPCAGIAEAPDGDVRFSGSRFPVRGFGSSWVPRFPGSSVPGFQVRAFSGSRPRTREPPERNQRTGNGEPGTREPRDRSPVCGPPGAFQLAALLGRRGNRLPPRRIGPSGQSPAVHRELQHDTPFVVPTDARVDRFVAFAESPNSQGSTLKAHTQGYKATTPQE